MPSHTRILVVATAFSFGASLSVHAQNLLVNPSFESNAGNGSTTGPGWTFLNNVDYRSGEGSTDGTFAAVFNDADRSNTGVVFQTLANTVPGSVYQVSFDYGNYFNNGAQQLNIQVRNGSTYNAGSLLIDPGSATINAASGGTIDMNTASLQVSDATGTSTAGSGPEFNRVNFTFTAQGPASTLVFTDVGNFTASSDLVLDNVSVVPEPATWAMAFGGMVLLVGAQRIRRSQTRRA